jgi:hypothetical protein
MDVPLDKLRRKFRALEAEIINPSTGKETELLDVIVNLNEDTDYSREEIADWLCARGGCRHAAMYS